MSRRADASERPILGFANINFAVESVVVLILKHVSFWSVLSVVVFWFD